MLLVPLLPWLLLLLLFPLPLCIVKAHLHILLVPRCQRTS
jgi:hypothetical protein